jgi:hypothetical protein
MRFVRLTIAVLVLAAVPSVARAQDPIPPATEFAQIVSLQDAAQAGLVKLSPKGDFFGDSVAVDLTGARIPGRPVQITVRIEFLGEQKNGDPWSLAKAQEIEHAIENRIGPLKSSDGTQVTVDLDVRVRSGTDPKSAGTPGYHQIELVDRPPASDASMVSGKPFGPNGEHSGNWGVNETATTLAHETGHLLGIHDRYVAREPDYVVDGKRYPLPKLPKGASDKQINAWWEKVLDAAKKLEQKHGKGEIEPGIPKGHEDDLMADGSGKDNTKSFLSSDLDDFVARAGVRMNAQPGDILLNKSGGDQNLGVGAALSMFAPRGQSVHRDGLFGYCIDLHKGIPSSGGFDVLDSAAANGVTNFGALRAVLAEIARRQAAGADSSGPLGAVEAVWAVTDAFEPTGEAASILAAAGVTFNQQRFEQTPHLDDPNAAGAGTAAVTTAGVLPALASDSSPPPERLGSTDLRAPRLEYAALAKRRIRPGKHRRLALRTVVARSDALVTIRARHKKRGKAAGKRARGVTVTLPVGPNVETVRVRVRRPGRYRLVIRGDVRHKLSFVVGRR